MPIAFQQFRVARVIDVIAVGNPCKVLREINEHDKEYYFKDKKIDYKKI